MGIDLKDAAGLGIAALGLAVGLYQYARTSRDEFLKPIRDAQLRHYELASSAAAQLATLPRGSTEWQGARNEFLKLYYGPLAIFEDYNHTPGGKNAEVTVERAMVAFKFCLDSPNCTEGELREMSLGLAHTCRVSLGRSWGFHSEQLDGVYQKLILNHRERER